MEQLLCMLYAIQFYSKDIHYACKGSGFYSDHLLADKVNDDIDDYIDQINEKMFLGNEHDAPYSKDIMKETIGLIPPVSGTLQLCWQNLYFLIRDTIALINKIEDEYGSAELNSLLDAIADDLQAKKGLIWRRKMSS